MPQPPWIHEALAPKAPSRGRLLNRFRLLMLICLLGEKFWLFQKFLKVVFKKNRGWIIENDHRFCPFNHCLNARRISSLAGAPVRFEILVRVAFSAAVT